jgi:hypothetical protein
MSSLHSLQVKTCWGLKSENYPSLELCKKLTSHGFPDTNANYYCLWNDIRFYERYSDSTWEFWDYCEKHSVCPSIAELLDELPIEIRQDGIWYMLVIWGNWCLQYYPDNFNAFHRPLADFRWTLPNALAEMWLHLKENNYITK